jgi:hypothetical protein
MPAVTVPDITLLARTPVADLLTARPRPVISLSTAPSGFEGEGFPVRRAFMGAPLAAIDPFIMLDQMGEVEYAPGEPKGRRGIRIADSRPLPTCSTASSTTATAMAVADASVMATRSG